MSILRKLGQLNAWAGNRAGKEVGGINEKMSILCGRDSG